MLYVLQTVRKNYTNYSRCFLENINFLSCKRVMASTSVHLTQLSDVTECPICTDDFVDPRVLPCIHTYCARCLETYIKGKETGERVPCPMCKKTFTIPENGIEGLPRNFFIEKLLTIRDITNVQTARKKCESCADADNDAHATVFCLDCQQSLCATCDSFHKRIKSTRSHRSVKIGDRSESDNIYAKCPPTFCSKHGDKQLELYCLNCKVAICVICYIECHNSHKCSDVSKIADEFRQLLKNDVTTMADGISKCCEVVNSLETNAKEFAVQIADKRREISERAELLKTAIDRHKQQLVEQLEIIERQRVAEIERVSQDVKERTSVIESCRKYAEELLNKGTTGDVARVASDLHQRAAELLKFEEIQLTVQNLGSVEVNFSPTSISPDDGKNIVGNIKATSSTKGNLQFDFPHYPVDSDLKFLSPEDTNTGKSFSYFHSSYCTVSIVCGVDVDKHPANLPACRNFCTSFILSFVSHIIISTTHYQCKCDRRIRQKRPTTEAEP